jgi:hypothetical protein
VAIASSAPFGTRSTRNRLSASSSMEASKKAQQRFSR